MKYKLLSGLILIFVIFTISSVSADLIDPNTHIVDGCSKIVNLNDFPEITLIGYIKSVSGPDNDEAYLIINNDCLNGGYKFNRLMVYWANSDSITGMSNNQILSQIKDGNSNYHLLNKNFELPGGYISDSNPLIKKENSYSVFKDAAGNYGIYMSAQSEEYSAESKKSPKISNYPIPEKAVKEKILPETASLRAKQRLGELGFNITLKEVRIDDTIVEVYDATATADAKLFGFIKKKANVEVLIDEYDGSIIKINKPWWSFIASGV